MKKNGFTLIELLAVIAIIAVVLVITIPAVLRVRKNAFAGISKEEEANLKDAALVLAIELDDYSTDVYNCKGWMNADGKCHKTENKWDSFTVTIDELVEHGYFQDNGKHCSGEIYVKKNENGTYLATMSDAKCEN